MAGRTEKTGGVFRRHLREALRLGCIGLVAAETKHRRIEFGGLERRRVVGMPGLRSVAGLAVNSRMAARLLRFRYVIVAGLAGLVTGELDRPGRNLRQRSAAVVSVLPKAPGNQKA